MTREYLHFRIFLLALFLFLFVIFHINIRIQVVSLGYELSNLRAVSDRFRKREAELQLQGERLTSAKALLRLLDHERFAQFHLPRSDQIIFLRTEK